MISVHYSGYRPYFVEGKEIGLVNLYGSGQIYYTANCGWLEHIPFHDDEPANCRNDVQTIHTDNPVRANKVNLERTDNYYLYDKKLELMGKRYALFIHVEPPTPIGEYLLYETATSLEYCTFAAFGLKCQVDRIGKIESIILQVASRTVKTPFSDECDRWEKRLKEDGIDMSGYTLQNLLKKYKLIPVEKQS